MSIHPGMTRDDALSLLSTHLKNEKMIWHSLASEAVMRAMAGHFSENADAWGLAGLLHDIDYEIVNEDPATHGKVAAELLRTAGIHPDIIDAIVQHNAEGLGITRSGRFAHALACSESITGLISATALVYPDKKLASVKAKSVTKRMGTAHFARAVSRERIRECETINLPLADFVALSLGAMQAIASDIGL